MTRARHSSFGKCYAASWWESQEREVSTPLTTYPNGTKLNAADSAFFAALGANGRGWPLNSKATFCYCAQRGVEALYRHSTNPAHTSWLMLSASLTWLIVVLAAEAYLCCRPSPDAVDEVETVSLVEARSRGQQSMTTDLLDPLPVSKL